jgi:hypothetical protein
LHVLTLRLISESSFKKSRRKNKDRNNKELKNCMNLKISTLEGNILSNRTRWHENILRMNKDRIPKKHSRAKIEPKCPRGRQISRFDQHAGKDVTQKEERLWEETEELKDF